MVAAHKAGLATTHRLNGGHRDVKSTECPGDKAYARIGEINRLAEASWNEDPETAPKPPRPQRPKRPKPPADGKLDVDGWYGPATVRAKQRALGTPVDGIVSGQLLSLRDNNPGLLPLDNWEWSTRGRGSMMIEADQRRLKKKGFYKGAIDGLAGPVYWRAVQRELGTPIDGRITVGSNAVKALQRQLNKANGY